MPEANDNALLAEYARTGSEPAFATLVQRHIALVHSVALRHVGNPSHAEEITQAVFIILARKAKALGRVTVLCGWLYQTARLTAANFLRAEQRRQRREQEAYVESLLNQPTPEIWPQVAPLLDDAMDRLGETDRNVIVLRFFENKSAREIADALAIDPGTAQKRVTRAVERLRNIFLKRGVTHPAAALAEAISTNAVQAAPVALAKTVTTVALAKGAATGGSTLTLVKGALKIMAWTKAKAAMIAGVVILAAGTATITIHHFAGSRAESLQAGWQKYNHTPGGALTLQAATYLKRLKTEGKLPGFQKDQRAWILLPMELTNAESYPVARTFAVRQVNTNRAPFAFHYTLEKLSAASSWQLRKAWRTDKSGKFIEEYPVR